MIKRIKLRTLLIGGCITLFFVLLLGRVFWLQIVEGNFWQAHAESIWSQKKVIPAQRGQITDRNGDILAMNAPAYTVAVNPQIIKQLKLEDEIIEGLSKLLNKDAGEIKSLIEAINPNTGKLYAQRELRNEGWQIDQTLKNKVQAFKEGLEKKYNKRDVGIVFIAEQKRYYPKNSLASHVLGYISREGKAISGIESSLNDKLKGVDGSLEYKSDGKGIEIPKASEIYTPPKDGENVALTIDYTIQYYIEEAVKEAYNELNPISISVIAANPKTMEILGMANAPTFNPNTYGEAEEEGFYNHATRSQYEPGSTFKIVTLAGAIQEGFFNPDATYMAGKIRVPGRTIRDSSYNKLGSIPLTYRQGVIRSSNVAFIKMGYEMMGPDLLKQYVDNFGFGKKTGIELSGEIPGIVAPKYAADFAAMSYGHGQLLVTPLQQIVAISAVANGGKLMKPHIVKETTNPQTEQVTVTKPEVISQVITPETAKQTGLMLEEVVSDQKNGTGRHAYIDGYRVAGKTGTAIKVINGQYDHTKQVVSFIGYAPVDDPKIAVIVVIDQPQNSDLGGGTAAAPVFKKIVSQSLQYMGVPKRTDKQATKVENTLKVPDLSGLTLKAAKDKLVASGITYATLGKGDKLVSQFPKAGTTLQGEQYMYLLTEAGDKIQIPDVKGRSLRDAMEILSALNVTVKSEGIGYVVSQTTTNENGKRVVTLRLEAPDADKDDKAAKDKDKDKDNENQDQDNKDKKQGTSGAKDDNAAKREDNDEVQGE
ncbi:penicillin-binding protein 2B [Paenibacillus turicensis]|uniref:Penicillin-binding protein 2B n=1 Tax=Paenibacillus turicensis TaxID=160487 RepID=A0ABS4FP68_9BACL|nr:penicillin-binding transpeptidase domain-containing protein [Paenibacillus turicensis]MBP1904370.1 penicillin-binding protein 2B [Paenibacillus turicensis]